MAVNGSSHNIPGLQTGPVTSAPPPVSSDVKNDIFDAASKDGLSGGQPHPPLSSSPESSDSGDYGSSISPSETKSELEAAARRMGFSTIDTGDGCEGVHIDGRVRFKGTGCGKFVTDRCSGKDCC